MCGLLLRSRSNFGMNLVGSVNQFREFVHLRFEGNSGQRRKRINSLVDPCFDTKSVHKDNSMPIRSVKEGLARDTGTLAKRG
jgi:hypothetical protein